MRKISSFLIIAIIMASLAYAQGSVDWGAKDSDSDEKFASNFEKYPAGGFDKNPGKAWAAIEKNPSLMTKPEFLDAAFKNDKYRAAGVLDKNPSLMVYKNVAERYNAEAINNVNLLNENPKARDALLAFKFRIENKGSLIYSYDGKYIGTGDPNRGRPITLFAAKDFPDSIITENGELIPSIGKKLHSGTAYKDKDGSIIAEKGFLILGSDIFSGPRLVHYQSTVASQDEAFLFLQERMGQVVIKFAEGSLAKDGDDFIVAPGTKLEKYIRDEQGNTLRFGTVTADKPIRLSQAFGNCRDSCVAFNPVESRVRITESGASVIRTSYNPTSRFETPSQNGYKFYVPSSNGFRLSAANGETSVGQNGIVHYSPASNPEMQLVGSIWHAVPETPTFKDLGGLPKISQEDQPELVRILGALRTLPQSEVEIGKATAEVNVRLDWPKIFSSGRFSPKSTSGTFRYPIGSGLFEAKFELIRGNPSGAVTYTIKW